MGIQCILFIPYNDMDYNHVGLNEKKKYGQCVISWSIDPSEHVLYTETPYFKVYKLYCGAMIDLTFILGLLQASLFNNKLVL